MVQAQQYNATATQTFCGIWSGKGGTITQDSFAHGTNASATGSHAHAEGINCSATGWYSHAEGVSTQATGTPSHAEGGSTVAFGGYAHAEGYQTYAGAEASHAAGAKGRAIRYGQYALGAGSFTSGTAQATTMAFGAETTDATPKVLTSDLAAAAPTRPNNPNVLTLPANRAHMFRLLVVARHHDNAGNPNGDAAGWLFTGLIYRGYTGPTTIAPNMQADTWATAGAGAWDLTVNADAAPDPAYLRIVATGQAGKTIQWTARIDTAEAG